MIQPISNSLNRPQRWVVHSQEFAMLSGVPIARKEIGGYALGVGCDVRPAMSQNSAVINGDLGRP